MTNKLVGKPTAKPIAHPFTNLSRNPVVHPVIMEVIVKVIVESMAKVMNIAINNVEHFLSNFKTVNYPLAVFPMSLSFLSYISNGFLARAGNVM
jgi:predicted acyltransferase